MGVGRLGWFVGALAAGALAGAACGGDGGRAERPATATVRPAAERPTVEDQLAILDGARDPAPYAAALDDLARRCRESRERLADAVVEARRALERERGVAVSVLDYLRGLDRVVPADATGADCAGVAQELGRTIGR